MIQDLVFPINCCFCDSPGGVICINCRKNCLERHSLKIAKSLDSNLSLHLYLVDYSELYKNFIHYGKYRFNKSVWRIIGEILKNKVQIKPRSVVTYVPLHWMRYCYRGFNQAAIIAKKINKTKSLLKRVKNNDSFTKLNKETRIVKSKELFKTINKDLSEIYTCYLVDDIYTTGATMEACAALLKERYPHLEIIGISFAKTPKHSKFMVI